MFRLKIYVYMRGVVFMVSQGPRFRTFIQQDRLTCFFSRSSSAH